MDSEDLLSCDPDRVAEAQARPELRGDVNDTVAIDEHRARDSHARRRLLPAHRTLDEDGLGSRVRQRAGPFPA